MSPDRIVRKKAVLVTFSTRSDRFQSAYERNKFFRGLYGFKQVVKHGSDKYEYERDGILGDIPHIKVDQSLFMIRPAELERVMDYFEEWHDKVMCKTFQVLIDEMQARKLRMLKEMRRNV